MSCHLQNSIRHPELKSDNTLHVIGVISNPVRYHSRYRLFHQWAKEMVNTPNVELHVVESVHGDRMAECYPEVVEGEAPSYNYLSVRTSEEIWLKENLINLAVRHLLPKDWKYVAWVDCDIHFRNPGWALESIHQLQCYQIIQPWSDALHLSFDGGILEHSQSLGYRCAKGMKIAAHNKPKHVTIDDVYGSGHTGFAWACTRYFYENVEKLIDFAILGSADANMAWGCLGDIQQTVNGHMSKGFKEAMNRWQKKAVRACHKLIGYTPGRIEHNFHGPLRGRGYSSRWQILVKWQFDPFEDLRYDAQGIHHLVGKPGLAQAIMKYNRSRIEDSIENF